MKIPIPEGKLVIDKQVGDGKRMYIIHHPKKGQYSDFGVEIDTDDVDFPHVIAMADELIRRWNSFEK